MDTLTVSQVHELERRRYAAMLAPDVDALAELLSDDVIYTHSNATIDSKTSYLDVLRTGTLVYLTLRHTTDSVLVRPGVAIVSGTMSGSVRRGGVERALFNLVAAVWVAEDDRWRLAAFQPTPVPA